MKKIILIIALIVIALFFFMNTKKEPFKFRRNFVTGAPSIFNQEGEKISPRHIVSKDYVFLYFSASWCGPCHAFNPRLIDWYNSNDGGNNFEIVLVGADSDSTSIRQYFNDQKFPFTAMEKKGKIFSDLFEAYCGPGIPSLVLLNKDDEVVASSYQNGKYVGPDYPLKYYEENIKPH